MLQPVREKIILGIDPGTNLMGYGVLCVRGVKPEMVAMGVIDLRKYSNHYLKLKYIHERVEGVINGFLPVNLDEYGGISMFLPLDKYVGEKFLSDYETTSWAKTVLYN